MLLVKLAAGFQLHIKLYWRYSGRSNAERWKGRRIGSDVDMRETVNSFEVNKKEDF